MIIVLFAFLYLIIGLVFAVLMVRYADYNPGMRGEPSPFLIIAAWPIVLVIMGVIGCNDLMNKILSYAKKENNDSN